MLINCGACEDIREYLKLSPQARLIVVDSHRPIHARCPQAARMSCLTPKTWPAIRHPLSESLQAKFVPHTALPDSLVSYCRIAACALAVKCHIFQLSSLYIERRPHLRSYNIKGDVLNLALYDEAEGTRVENMPAPISESEDSDDEDKRPSSRSAMTLRTLTP